MGEGSSKRGRQTVVVNSGRPIVVVQEGRQTMVVNSGRPRGVVKQWS